MKATYTTANGRLSFEVEGSSVKELFERVAGVQEIFEQPEGGWYVFRGERRDD
jgi:hypothetical protein